MNVILWWYAFFGTLAWVQYMSGQEVMVRIAHGPIWLLLMAAPITLSLLILLPVVDRILGKRP
jgi:hypothetical protein